MANAILYCRVSSDRQVRDGHGLDGQEARCRTYARDHGYTVVAVFRDEGVSGGIVDRDGMQAMLDFLDRGRHDEPYVVVIDDLKRLARDLIGHFTLRKAIESRGGKLESPSHQFSNEPEGIFVESIMAATAELERNQNRRQVRHRMQARLEAGYWPFCPPPGYAYAKVPGHGKLLVRKEPTAGVIQEALEGFASGRFPSQADVGRFLRARGFVSRNAKGVTYPEQVKRLLTREVYTGFLSYPPWQVTTRKGHHEPLISPDTFDRIQERLTQKARLPARKDIRKDFPLRGFIVCTECRRPLTASWNKGKARHFPYYRCNTLGCPLRNKCARAERLHGQFEALLGRLKPRQTILEVVRRELLSQWHGRMMSVEAVRKERQRKLDAIRKEINGYLEAIDRCSSPVVIQRIEEKIEELQARELRLGGRIRKPKGEDYDFETALNGVLDFLKNPLLMWKNGNLSQKRLVLRLVFAEALCYDREQGFGTPSFSLPINVSCVTELDDLEMVVATLRRSNRDYGDIRSDASSVK
jgi:DNA invertase Pin-like site-specific DNA recombinase